MLMFVLLTKHAVMRTDVSAGNRISIYHSTWQLCFILFIVHETDVQKRYKIKQRITVGSLAVAWLIKPLTQRHENTYRIKT